MKKEKYCVDCKHFYKNEPANEISIELAKYFNLNQPCKAKHNLYNRIFKGYKIVLPTISNSNFNCKYYKKLRIINL